MYVCIYPHVKPQTHPRNLPVQQPRPIPNKHPAPTTHVCSLVQFPHVSHRFLAAYPRRDLTPRLRTSSPQLRDGRAGIIRPGCLQGTLQNLSNAASENAVNDVLHATVRVWKMYGRTVPGERGLVASVMAGGLFYLHARVWRSKGRRSQARVLMEIDADG